jgi:acetyl-CoA C-acetyltransferase
VQRAVLDDVARAAGVGVADLPDVADVVIGNCLGPGGNPARVAALRAGLGEQVPAVTVDRQCGSGQEALHLAATAIRAGLADLVLAGGAESASTAPWRLRRPASATGLPTPYLRAPFAPAELGDPDMGEAAEAVGRAAGVSRERQDAYAARSHRLAVAAAQAGVFDAELVPVAGVSADERPRGLRAEVLARLRPAFAPDGAVTAGNSCGISDGAAVVAMVPERVRARWGLPGLAVRGWVTVGVDPALPGLGPVPAVRALLARTGVPLADIGALEITEAFAAQVLACADALGLDPLGADDARFCAQGGAIALGHPWGASGTLLAVRLFAAMVRVPGPRWGLATCAVGGGQGMALLVERVGP